MTGSYEGKVIAIPHFTGYLSEILAIFINKLGFETKILPPSDFMTLNAVDNWTKGDECMTLQVLVGDYIKALESGYCPKDSLFLVPRLSAANCRINSFQEELKRIFQEAGFSSAGIIDPDFCNGDEINRFVSESMSRSFWQGVIACEVIYQAMLLTRAVSEDPLAAEEEAAKAAADILNVIKNFENDESLEKLLNILGQAALGFSRIVKDKQFLPLVGLVGEPFSRFNDLLNNRLILRIESFGGRVWITPPSDEIRNIFLGVVNNYDQLLEDENIIRDIFTQYWSKNGIEMINPSFEELSELGSKMLPKETGLDWTINILGRTRWMLSHLKVNGLCGIYTWPCMLSNSAVAFQRSFKLEFPDRPVQFFWSKVVELDWTNWVRDFMDNIRQ